MGSLSHPAVRSAHGHAYTNRRRVWNSHPWRRPRRGLGLGSARVRGEAGGNVSVWNAFGDEPVESHWHLYRSERYGPAPQTKSGFKVVPSGQSGSSEPPSSTAVRLGDRLALVVAQMLAQAKRPGPSPGFPLVQGRQQAINPDHPHLPGTRSAQTSRPEPQPSAPGRPHPAHQQKPCRHHR